MTSASFDADQASTLHESGKLPAAPATVRGDTFLGLPRRATRSSNEECPGSGKSRIRLSDSIVRRGDGPVQRQPNGAPYDVIRYREPGSGVTAELTGIKTANGGFDVKNQETNETIAHLAIVDSSQPDGTAGSRVGVDPEHAKLPGGMQGGRSGSSYPYSPHAMQTPGAGPSSAASHAAFPTTAPTAAPSLPWVVGNQQLAAHIPPITATNLSQLDRSQLRIALRAGHYQTSNVSSYTHSNGSVTHQFTVSVNPATRPLSVRATVSGGVLQEIRLNPPSRSFRFGASPQTTHAVPAHLPPAMQMQPAAHAMHASPPLPANFTLSNTANSAEVNEIMPGLALAFQQFLPPPMNRVHINVTPRTGENQDHGFTTYRAQQATAAVTVAAEMPGLHDASPAARAERQGRLAATMTHEVFLHARPFLDDHARFLQGLPPWQLDETQMHQVMFDPPNNNNAFLHAIRAVLPHLPNNAVRSAFLREYATDVNNHIIYESQDERLSERAFVWHENREAMCNNINHPFWRGTSN
ncbi:hypothetical protein [Burkholderia sp. Bp9142]|uniref:hypothetical protein n=1 Tax=Burkholderia sp. Bp9142 TaxID=2184573 RepID=UPI000F596B70|nr:hypothetical protein [Burkholderia sp. Bp9142]RQR34214.1 hypothetical protein DIE22_16570 [Burkholderia sp. Bp9142]